MFQRGAGIRRDSRSTAVITCQPRHSNPVRTGAQRIWRWIPVEFSWFDLAGRVRATIVLPLPPCSMVSGKSCPVQSLRNLSARSKNGCKTRALASIDDFGSRQEVDRTLRLFALFVGYGVRNDPVPLVTSRWGILDARGGSTRYNYRAHGVWTRSRTKRAIPPCEGKSKMKKWGSITGEN